MQRSQHSFPAAYALQLVTLLQRWEIAADALLAPFSLTEAQLAVPNERISADTLRALTERARELSGEPGLGFYLGLQRRLSMYGYLGFAAMHASTVRESLELAERYMPALTTGLRMRLEVNGEVATLHFEELVELGSTHDVATFSLLVGMAQLSAAQTGRAARHIEVDIPFSKPEYFERFAHLLPNARFDQPSLCVRFPARGLDVPLKTPDRAALELARAACEQQLHALGFDRSFGARVRRLCAESEALLAIDAAARVLAVSERTLKRKLAAEGLTFSSVIEDERRTRAQQLLRTTELSLDAIAERLGYSSLSNFSRAFRRWTGEPPAKYRKRRA